MSRLGFNWWGIEAEPNPFIFPIVSSRWIYLTVTGFPIGGYENAVRVAWESERG